MPRHKQRAQHSKLDRSLSTRPAPPLHKQHPQQATCSKLEQCLLSTLPVSPPHKQHLHPITCSKLQRCLPMVLQLVVPPAATLWPLRMYAVQTRAVSRKQKSRLQTSWTRQSRGRRPSSLSMRASFVPAGMSLWSGLSCSHAVPLSWCAFLSLTRSAGVALPLVWFVLQGTVLLKM